MKNVYVRPDWWVVALDETKHWNIPREDRRYIGKIIEVFFFNRNSYTYVAEITPSYYLIHAYNDVWFKRGSDSKREELHTKYIYDSGVTNEDTYMHVGTVENYMKKHPKMVYHYGQSDADHDEEDRESGDETRRAEDEVREWLNGNPPL